MTNAMNLSPVSAFGRGSCPPMQSLAHAAGAASGANFRERGKPGRMEDGLRRTLDPSTRKYDRLPSEPELAALADIGLSDAQIAAYWRLAPRDVAILRRAGSP